MTRTRDILPLAVALVVSALIPAPVAAEPGAEVSLFHITRNKNRNQVHYTLKVTPTCSFATSAPMGNHWLMLEKGAEVTEEVGLMEQMAYGFKSQKVVGDTVKVKLKALPSRVITVVLSKEAGRCEARAFGVIKGKRAILKRIEVYADESSLMPEVVYVDLVGQTPKGQPIRERIKPE